MTGGLSLRKEDKQQNPAYRGTVFLLRSHLCKTSISNCKGCRVGGEGMKGKKNCVSNERRKINMEVLNNHTKLLNDFQHQIENKINRLKDIPSFPKKGEGLSDEMLDDYLFEYQAALDSKGSERTQYTIAGFLMVVPILIISAIPDKNLPFGNVLDIVLAIVIGLMLFGIYKVLSAIMVRNKIRKINNEYPVAKNYVDKVKAFKD